MTGSCWYTGDGSELPCEGSLPHDGKLNGFVSGSSAPAAFNAASFAAHMTRAQRAAVAASGSVGNPGSAGASPKAGAGTPQAFANGSAKRCAALERLPNLQCIRIAEQSPRR